VEGLKRAFSDNLGLKIIFIITENIILKVYENTE